MSGTETSGNPMATAKAFRHGSRLLVELPADFHLSADELKVHRRGDEVVLADSAKETGTPVGKRLIEIIQSMPEDMFQDIKDNRPPEHREGL